MKRWTLVEPGVIEMPGTGFQIHFDRQRECYQIYRLGISVCVRDTLLLAKGYVENYIRDMREMGLDP